MKTTLTRQISLIVTVIQNLLCCTYAHLTRSTFLTSFCAVLLLTLCVGCFLATISLFTSGPGHWQLFRFWSATVFRHALLLLKELGNSTISIEDKRIVLESAKKSLRLQFYRKLPSAHVITVGTIFNANYSSVDQAACKVIL